MLMRLCDLFRNCEWGVNSLGCVCVVVLRCHKCEQRVLLKRIVISFNKCVCRFESFVRACVVMSGACCVIVGVYVENCRSVVCAVGGGLCDVGCIFGTV
jgi:hypothetical protein